MAKNKKNLKFTIIITVLLLTCITIVYSQTTSSNKQNKNLTSYILLLASNSSTQFIPKTSLLYQLLTTYCDKIQISCPANLTSRDLTYNEALNYLSLLEQKLKDTQFKKSPYYPEVKYYTQKAKKELESSKQGTEAQSSIGTKPSTISGNFRLWLDNYAGSNEVLNYKQLISPPYQTGFAHRIFLSYNPNLGTKFYAKLAVKSEQSKNILGKKDVLYIQADEIYLGYKSKHLNLKYGRQYVGFGPYGILVHDNFFPFDNTFLLHYRLFSFDFYNLWGNANRPPEFKLTQNYNLYFPFGGQARFPEAMVASQYYSAQRIEKTIKGLTLAESILVKGGDNLRGFGFDAQSKNLKYEYANYYNEILDKNFKAQLFNYNFNHGKNNYALTFADVAKDFQLNFSALNISADESDYGGLPDILQNNFKGYGLSLTRTLGKTAYTFNFLDGKSKDNQKLPVQTEFKFSHKFANNAIFNIYYSQLGKDNLHSRLRLELWLTDLFSFYEKQEEGTKAQGKTKVAVRFIAQNQAQRHRGCNCE
ncbi:hypothetical protein M1437_02510 [Patescibacteria group bacterium]|nr:hypothetical protein [Patescibacteria group bacterium]